MKLKEMLKNSSLGCTIAGMISVLIGALICLILDHCEVGVVTKIICEDIIWMFLDIAGCLAIISIVLLVMSCSIELKEIETKNENDLSPKEKS